VRALIGPNPLRLEEALADLVRDYPEVEFTHCVTRDDLAAEIGKADIYMGWLSRDEFLAASRLRWIQSPSTGIDGFLAIPELRKSDVFLTSARGTHAAVLAEHTFALIFAFTRGLWRFFEDQRAHEWTNRKWRSSLVELTGSTLGIIGFGTVGRAIARRAQAFDMRIVAIDVEPGDSPDYVDSLRDTSGLDDLLRVSDYIVVTVPLTEETVDLLRKAELALVKPTAILIGISRGGIINEQALVEALESGRLAGAALDVVANEPLPKDSVLWDVPNLIITPHVAGGTQFEAEHVLAIFRDNLSRYLAGRSPLLNQIDKARGF